MNDSAKDTDDIDAQAYLDHRKRLDDLRISQWTAYDSALLTLSTGAIGVSLALLQWIAQSATPKALPCLGISWGCLVVALCATLISHQASAEDATREIAKIDRDLVAGRRLTENGNLFRTLTHWLNRISLAGFIVGTIFLLLFAYGNAIGPTDVQETDEPDGRNCRGSDAFSPSCGSTGQAAASSF